MKQEKFTISSNIPLTTDVFEMQLKRRSSTTDADIRCGQFVNVLVDGLFLRRPISVCNYCNGQLTLLYKVVGRGTEAMSKMTVGNELDILIDLGNGYDLSRSGETPLLIGGGVGIPPLYMACKKLVEQGKKPTVILGFNKAEEIFYKKEFEALTSNVILTTVDGSCGTKGFVTDAINELTKKGTVFSYFYTCGPEPMLKAIYNSPSLQKVEGEFSFEERMGCGFGACMGCSCKTITGNKRICKEGPVLQKNEILWR